MHACDDLGLLVAAVVQDRLVQSTEARARVHRHVVDVEALDQVDHEVGARIVDEVALALLRGVLDGAVLVRELRAARRCGTFRRLVRGLSQRRLGTRKRDTRSRRTCQESAPADAVGSIVFPCRQCNPPEEHTVTRA